MKTSFNRKMIRWPVALVALLLANAATADLVCDDPDDGIDPPLPTDVCIAPEDADTPRRWLGLANGTTCPQASAPPWITSKLFDPGGDQGIPPGLSKYCLYTFLPSGIPAEPPDARLCPAPPGQPCLVQLDPDSLSMSYLGGSTQTIEGLVWESLRDHFVEQTGATGALAGPSDLIRLAVVDTEPTGLGEYANGQGASPHGFTLLNMMREMICPPSGSCGIQLQSRLGLPLRFCSNEPASPCPCMGNPNRVCEDEVNGGYVGTIGNIAVAIRDEVREWLMPPAQRLVINLSVGWDPLFGGVPGGPVAVQAVKSAIEDARCRGALVFAAAGNRVSGPGSTSGALLPGGWEELPAPGFTTCGALLEAANPPDSNDFPSGQQSYFPLVYSAAAVKNNNEPAAQRPGGEPPLVAFGDHAVATDPIAGPGPTATLTGSSVASAVVSAAAAAAWHQRPTAAGYEIMEAVYGAAYNLGRTADYCEGGSPCSLPVHRVTACTAVLGACSTLPGGACPITSCEAPNPVLPSIAVDAIDADYVATMALDVDISALGKVATISNCREGYVLHWSSGLEPDNPCPQQQFYGVQVTPWTDGQPSGQPCETCTTRFHSPGKLYLEVKTEFDGNLTDITLLCGDDAYRLDETLAPGDKLRMREIPEHCEFEELAVSYRVDTGGGSPASAVSPVLLVRDRDDDGIQDGDDNCIQVANPDQRDTNADGIGNICDTDIAGTNCSVNFGDVAALKPAVPSMPGDPEWNEDADFNGDGFVNFGDVAQMKSMFLGQPGPSATGCN